MASPSNGGIIGKSNKVSFGKNLVTSTTATGCLALQAGTTVVEALIVSGGGSGGGSPGGGAIPFAQLKKYPVSSTSITASSSLGNAITKGLENKFTYAYDALHGGFKLYLKDFINTENLELQKIKLSLIDELENFYETCTTKLGLNIIGLMCLPPENVNAASYFLKIKNLNKKLNLKDLSIGMSADYLEALKFNSTFIRVGSKIFGKRN